MESGDETEKKRLVELFNFKILDTESEQDFEELVELASHICGTPISLITLVDRDRQWFKARTGLDIHETPRDVAFCAHAILIDDLTLIRDATLDERFSQNPLVTGDPNIRFYAGMPLITENGYKLGTICVIDRKPRELNEGQQKALRTLGRQVVRLLELRLRNIKLQKLNAIQSKTLSIVGHDVRKPFTNLVSLTQILTERDVPHESLLPLKGEIRELLDVTDLLLTNLLEWGVAQSESGGLKLEEVFLAPLIKMETEAQLSDLQKKRNEFKFNVPVDAKALVDKGAFRFLIRNFISNANKFTASGTIEVSVTQNNRSTVICISDTGVGMTPDKLNKLFDWENRASTLGTAGENGSGIALHFCEELTLEMGGKINVSSRVGKGSNFWITLPSSFN